MNPRVTIDITEYERLKKEIRDKDAYIHQAEVEGKIKVEVVTKYVFQENSYRPGIYYHMRSSLLSSSLDCLMTKEEIEEIENNDIKNLISDVVRKKQELEEDYNERMGILKTRTERLDDMGWFGRLKFLFTGTYKK